MKDKKISEYKKVKEYCTIKLSELKEERDALAMKLRLLDEKIEIYEKGKSLSYREWKALQ